MPHTTYARNKILDYMYGKQAFTVPDTLYLGLCTACTLAGAITGEPVGNGYARVAIDNNDLTTIWSAAANGQKSNGAGAIVFPTASGSWGTLTVGFITDAASGAGNVWCYGNLTAAITPVAGVTPPLPAGSFVAMLV